MSRDEYKMGVLAARKMVKERGLRAAQDHYLDELYGSDIPFAQGFADALKEAAA